MSSLFELQDVCFDYEGIPALRSLSLKVEQGQRIALVGANGSGKSTLLRLLDALCFPTRGQATFCGEALTQNHLRDDAFSSVFRRRVALVFQNPDVQLFNPTVFDEIAFGPLQLGLERQEVLRRIEEMLQFIGIDHLRDRPPYRLSGGEKKKVALASVLVMQPDVLLLDEPTAALDPKSQSQVVDLIQGWKNSHTTVITATHQLDLLEDIADLLYVMEQGNVVATARPSEILADRKLLLRANLVHEHRHAHGTVIHSHPHDHRHKHPHEEG